MCALEVFSNTFEQKKLADQFRDVNNLENALDKLGFSCFTDSDGNIFLYGMKNLALSKTFQLLEYIPDLEAKLEPHYFDSGVFVGKPLCNLGSSLHLAKSSWLKVFGGQVRTTPLEFRSFKMYWSEFMIYRSNRLRLSYGKGELLLFRDIEGRSALGYVKDFVLVFTRNPLMYCKFVVYEKVLEAGGQLLASDSPGRLSIANVKFIHSKVWCVLIPCIGCL
jgi:hypothetical protein